MALVVYDRVQQTGTANTTVSFSLSGSVTGYQSFSVVGNGNTTFYGATDTSGNWEVGIGTYATGGTLTRTTILASSNSGSAVTFSGTVTVFVTYPSEKSVNLDASGNVSALGTITSAVWNGTTIPVAYGGTGVTTSSGANSVVLRDSNSNITTNNTFNGYTLVTAAGGTTTMTAASTFYQKLVAGTGGQTFKLPDATTLPNGATYIFDNDSTGTLTIQDSTGGAIDTITAGALDYIYLESNGTVAGSWGQYAFVPASYDFNITSASFGNATISNAVWNGTTIASGYGGTGLTTFTAANNALYSTSSSALAAGTLPVAAGGTGATTLTSNGVLYGAGTGAVSATSAGTTGQVLIATTGSAPSWGSVPTTAAVTSFQTSLSGLTPSSSTTGAVTLAGTLGAANGGTGATTLTGYVYGNGTSAMTAATTIPTSALSGTVGITNGGTGQTTASAAFNALSPITTTGDLIIGNGTNSATRLGIGTNSYVLTSNGTTASWQAAGGSTTLTTTDFTATSGQTTFSVTYTPALLQGVYRNGIKLGQADYTATNGTSVVLATGAITGDLIQIQYFSSLATSTAVNSISFGSTGLTPSTASTGAVTVAGTLAIANGGTGQTTAAAAFNSLNPMTTTGDIIYESGTNTASRLAIGSTGQVLTVSGGVPAWAAAAGATITGTTTSGTYYVVGTTSTSGSLTTASISNTNAVSYNANTGALTAVSMVSSSDERLKENWRDLPDTFLNDLAEVKHGSYNRIGNEWREVGVSAQSLFEVLPESVPADDQGMLSVAYGNAALVAAIELAKVVQELRAEIKELKARLDK